MEKRSDGRGGAEGGGLCEGGLCFWVAVGGWFVEVKMSVPRQDVQQPFVQPALFASSRKVQEVNAAAHACLLHFLASAFAGIILVCFINVGNHKLKGEWRGQARFFCPPTHELCLCLVKCMSRCLFVSFLSVPLYKGQFCTTQRRKQKHRDKNTRPLTQTHTQTHTHTHTDTHRHTHTHTDRHTHTHTLWLQCEMNRVGPLYFRSSTRT